MGEGVFYNCTNLDCFYYPINWETVKHYTGAGDILFNCEKIKSINIPEGVTTIPECAFKNCNYLETLFLPDTLETIGNSAFYNCDRITDISIPYSVYTLEPDCFRDCSNLVSIELPNQLKSVGIYAFRDCESLSNIVLPNSVTEIGEGAFYNCINLESFNYPLDWKTVKHYTGAGNILYNCKKIRTIEVPYGIKEIPECAFKNCNYLRNIVFPQTLKKLGNSALYNCDALTSIDLPEGVLSIDSDCFNNCSNLISINLPESLTSIGIYSFRDCESLANIVLPNSITEIGEGAFYNCINLESFNYPLDWKTVKHYTGAGNILYNCKKIRTIEVPYGIEEIPECAFKNCNYLRNIVFPQTLKILGSSAFYNCDAITSIELPESVISINSDCFNNCSNLISINLPESLTSIGIYSFKDCESLSSIILPDSISEIGEGAFYNCINLESINYPLAWKTVKHYTGAGEILYNCKMIKSIDLPEGVQEIPECAFKNCNYLHFVNLPSTLKCINSSAFMNCSSLEKIYISPHVSILGTRIFENCQALTIWCEYGSYILNYCQDNSIPYYYLTPDGVNNPSGTLYQGDSYGIHGYARASIPLTEVTATIWNSDKTEIIQTITVHPEQTDYNLSSTVNYNLLFGDLALGSYRYTLIAATELSLETWADTSFTIVPQPLRISLSNFKGPSYLSDENNDFVVHGIIRSNYPITSVSIKIKNIDSAIIATASASPSSTYFSLSDLPITRSSWNGGIYTFELTATSNGETKALKTYTFGSTCASGSIEDIPENEIDDVTAYLLGVNENTFTEDPLVSAYMKEHAEEAVESMIWGNMFNVFSSYLRDILTGKDYQSYLVELYEKEIMDLIADLDESGLVEQHQEFKMFGGAKQFTDIVEDLFGTVGKVEKIPMTVYAKEIKELIDSNSLEDDELLYTTKQIYDNCKELTDLFDGLEIVEEPVNIINDFYTNHTTELALLDYIAENYNTSNSKEFTIALNNLRDQYSTEYGKSLKRLFNRLKTTLSKSAEKIITKYVFGEADIIVSLTKAMAKLGLKYSGLKEKGSANWTVMMRVEEFTIMRNNFNTKVAELKEVSANGTKLRVRQVADLRQFFTNARIALIRLYESLQEVDTPNYPKYSSLISSVKSMVMPGVPAILSDSDVIGGGSR